MTRSMIALALSLLASNVFAADTWNAPVDDPQGPIVLKVVMVSDEDGDPLAAGKQAAESLQAAMNGTPLKAILVSECFEDRDNKAKLLEGICSVVGQDVVFGGATYGSFTQSGCGGFDSVCLLGIGGSGVGVSAGLVTDLGTAKLTVEQHEAEITQRLHAAGKTLSERLARSELDRLLVLVPDAHSPKNRFLVEGAQQVFGKPFPMTGGSANKNAGQTFVYFRGQPYQDSAVAILLSGQFRVALSGRLAKDNDAVIRTAEEGMTEALAKSPGKPLAVLAYNCAGRRGKLKDPLDELHAIQKSLGTDTPLFGCYNAGEIGPLDATEKQPDALSGGSGWHVMFTVLTRE